MADRPKELEIVDRLRAAADSNHLYVFRVRRELVELGAETDDVRALLAESVRITLTDIPALTDDLRALAAQWSEVELLDPANLDSVSHAIEVRFAEVDPKLQAVTARHDEIIAELVALVRDARRS
jgi:hypothetical protein